MSSRSIPAVLAVVLFTFGLTGIAAAEAAVTVSRACHTPARPDFAVCHALIRSDVPRRDARSTPYGYGPADLQSAYALPSATAGAGMTVAVVDAYDYPSAEADLAVYRAQYGLPPCTAGNGCFRKVDQNGGGAYPSPDPGWAAESALDMEMVSAVCPQCHILLVEANEAAIGDLAVAVRTAAGFGAVAVSNSYGAPEFAPSPAIEADYDHPGVAITASSGDSGYGVQYPAASRHVTAVGGTSLRRGSTGSGWSESAWGGSGAGCSAFQTKPRWQTDSGCPRRTVGDVAAVADPATGVAVYDSDLDGGWQVMGGTSVAAPIVAAVYALAGRPASATYPASYPYAHAPSLNDIVSGPQGPCGCGYLCTAGPGYDGPTGLGSPRGVAAFSARG